MDLILGDCLEQLSKLKECSVDSVITDPPAGISFMGKAWDDDKGGRDEWIKWMSSVMKECLRVLKPGGHALVWAIPRTSHWTATAVEDAGFEVRDVVTHLFGSGFPKSLDISKAIDKLHGAEREVTQVGLTKAPEFAGKFDQASSATRERRDNAQTPAAIKWQGFGTALKPAAEFWVLARKPLSEKTVAKNVLKHGTGGLNIDASRIEFKSEKDKKSAVFGTQPVTSSKGSGAEGGTFQGYKNGVNATNVEPNAQGRFPANLVLSGDAPEMLDEQSGSRPSGGGAKGVRGGMFGDGSDNPNRANSLYFDTGGASRFFYCAKVSPSERNAGLDSSDLIWESDAWEKQGLNLLTENILQHAKDISEDLLTENKLWSTDLYGHSISEQYPAGFKSTIETVLKLITELKILSASRLSTTREIIQDAIKIIEKTGLNLAESVEFINQLSLNSTREETGYLLGVVAAVLPMLLKIKSCGRSGNFHATVKPQKLMQYLIKLITPPGGTVLDPFMGSGSTGLAAKTLGFNFIGIEKEKEYFNIADRRINGHTTSVLPSEEEQLALG